MNNSPFCLTCGKAKGRPRCTLCGVGAPGLMPETDPFALAPGVVLKGQYEIGRILGRGGFGITYLAIDQNLGMPVAIKEHLPRELAGRVPGSRTVAPLTQTDKAGFTLTLQRFAEEGGAIARLGEHPNVVQALTLFHENETAYLVMRYLEGEPLDAICDRTGRLPERQAVEIAIAILDGLRAVHDLGLIHRDIKPGNVFVTTKGLVKLLDFGSARDALQKTGTMTRLWTEGYAPFEQQRAGGQVGPWSDVYATGATLYRMLVGRTPPDAASERSAPNNPTRLEAPSEHGISEDVSRIVETALAMSPAHRFASAQAMQAALIHALGQQQGSDAPAFHVDQPVRTVTPVSPPPPPPPNPPPKKGGKGWLFAGLGGVGLVGVLGCGSVGLLGLVALFLKSEGHEDSQVPVEEEEVAVVVVEATECSDEEALGAWADARDAWDECRWGDAVELYSDEQALAAAPKGVQLCAQDRIEMAALDTEVFDKAEDRFSKGLCHVSLPDYAGYNGAMVMETVEGFEISPACEEVLLTCEQEEHEARKRDVEVSRAKLQKDIGADVAFRPVYGDEWRWDIVVEAQWTQILVFSLVLMASDDPAEREEGFAYALLAGFVMGEVGAESNRTLWVSRRLILEENGACYGWITTAQARDISGRINRARDGNEYVDALTYATSLMNDC